MHERSLNGEWDFRWDDAVAWQPLAVPGCWETLGPKHYAGPCTYRTTLAVEQEPGERTFVRFDGVSYACVVSVDGTVVGEHIGLWDAFEVEITDVIAGRREVELRVRVEKPASLSAGPGSEPMPGRHQTPDTLAGFLPYVWGHIFGGIWQDVTLRRTGAVVVQEATARGGADGMVAVSLALSAPAPTTLRLRDPDGSVLWTDEIAGERTFTHTLAVSEPRPWSPRDPALYTLEVWVADGDRRVIRFGLCTVGTSGTAITLNGEPIYPRMALSWGWYADALHSNPGPERVRADFARLRSLGFNGVKLCLWFPPEYYFDLADELGMLLWLEFPMWLPRASAFFRAQTPVEYLRLVRQAVQHPSVVMYTLGCELDAEVGGDILQPLFQDVKALVGDALVRDNSGSGEAYGGLLDESAEFYDYHFYADIQFFHPLLDFWTPRWRPVLPWLFGEYCDSDTFRDLRPLQPDAPWWLDRSPERNPQGARWQFDVVDQEQRLRAIGMWERGADLERISHAQSLLHRKWTIETTRAYNEISGYVITGEVDTPISTAGLWDDRARVKFDATAFRSFNEDTVVLVGWDKRRVWQGGGDRAAYWDTWSYRAGETVRAHLLVSTYGAAGHATLRWDVRWTDGETLAGGEHACVLPTKGIVRELAIAAFVVPEVARPRALVVRAALGGDGVNAANAWTLWCFPRSVAPPRVMLHDPTGRMELHGAAAPFAFEPWDANMRDLPLLATAWDADVEGFVRAGGHAVVLLRPHEAAPVPVVLQPFWREAVKVIEPHDAWRDFPHDGTVGLQFYGCATDSAMDTAAIADACAPLLRRVDARTMALHDYATVWTLGAGRAILTTLRFDGGLGDQPLGLGRNTAAAYLLGCWLDGEQGGGERTWAVRP